MEIYVVESTINGQHVGRVTFASKELAEKFIQLHYKICPAEMRDRLKFNKTIEEVVDTETMLMNEFKDAFPEEMNNHEG